MEQIKVSLDDELKAKVAARAQSYDLSVSAYIERMVRSAIETRERWEVEQHATPGQVVPMGSARSLMRSTDKTGHI